MRERGPQALTDEELVAAILGMGAAGINSRTMALQVNSALVLLCWRVGKRIRQDILKEKRADYGRQIVSTVGRELTTEFDQGFSEKSLWRMVQSAEAFPKERIIAILSRQLVRSRIRAAVGWTVNSNKGMPEHGRLRGRRG